MNVIGRLKPGVSKEQAQAEMTAIGARLEQQYPDKNLHRGNGVEPTLEALVGDIRPALLILFGAVGCVLSDCVRERSQSASGARHVATQGDGYSLSARRQSMRVVRQLLTESVLLSLAGRVAGIIAGRLVVRSFGRAGKRKYSARVACWTRLARAHFYAGGVCLDRNCIWPGPGAAFIQN